MHELSTGWHSDTPAKWLICFQCSFKFTVLPERATTRSILWKNLLLKKFYKTHRKNLCWSLFLIKMQAFRPTTLLESVLTQVFSCKYCETFKNTSFEEYLWKAGFVPKIEQTVFQNLYFELWKLRQSKIPFQKLIQIFPFNFCYPPPKFKYWLTNTCLMDSSFFLQLQQQYLLHIVH